MTTITIRASGHAPVTITIDGDAAGIAVRHDDAFPVPSRAPAPAALVAPVSSAPASGSARRGWVRNVLRVGAPVLAGLFGGLIIVGTRMPALPAASAQAIQTPGYGTTILPPLPGGGVGSYGGGYAGAGGVLPAQSANQAIAGSQQAMQPSYGSYGAGMPGGAYGGGSIAQSSTTPLPQGSQGGAPTADVAPTDGATQPVGARQAGTRPAQEGPPQKSPFGLEP